MDNMGSCVISRCMMPLLVLSWCIQAKVAAYSGGQGSVASPYVLSCKEDIMELVSSPEDYDKSFILTKDIDLEGMTFDGSILSPNIAFYPNFGEYKRLYTGCFNGNGHSIENFSIEGKGFVGFFGGIGTMGRVMHLGLKNVRIDGPGALCVGMLTGVNMGDIVGCYTQGYATGFADVGGLIGYQFRGHVRDCFSQGIVEGTEGGTGGLIGALGGGEIQRCYAASIVSSQNSAGRGGLAGIMTFAVRGGGPSPVVLNSFWDVDVSGLSASSGGLGLSTQEMYDVSTYLDAKWDFVQEQANGINDTWTGFGENGYPALSSFSTAKPVCLEGEGTVNRPYCVSRAKELAAITHYCGSQYFYYVLTSDIDLSAIRWSVPVLPRFTGSLDGRGHCIRGFYQDGSCGFFESIEEGAVVTDVRFEENVVAGMEGTVGCLAGMNRGSVRNCSVTGIVTGGTTTGGLVGQNKGNIWDCSFSGAARGHGCTGGVAGQNAGSITNSMSWGAVSGDLGVGGLAGQNMGTIRSCYSTATVIGYSSLGGLIGANDGSVRDCYARGLVAGAYCAGGLVGQNGRQVSHCYSVGAVVGVQDVGGLVGCADVSTGTASASFWDVGSSGIQISQGGTAADRSQMQDIKTFLDSGWDFVGETANGTADVWTMTDGDYPSLTLSLKPTSGAVRQ